MVRFFQYINIDVDNPIRIFMFLPFIMGFPWVFRVFLIVGEYHWATAQLVRLKPSCFPSAARAIGPIPMGVWWVTSSGWLPSLEL